MYLFCSVLQKTAIGHLSTNLLQEFVYECQSTILVGVPAAASRLVSLLHTRKTTEESNRHPGRQRETPRSLSLYQVHEMRVNYSDFPAGMYVLLLFCHTKLSIAQTSMGAVATTNQGALKKPAEDKKTKALKSAEKTNAAGDKRQTLQGCWVRLVGVIVRQDAGTGLDCCGAALLYLVALDEDCHHLSLFGGEQHVRVHRRVLEHPQSLGRCAHLLTHA